MAALRLASIAQLLTAVLCAAQKYADLERQIEELRQTMKENLKH